MKRTIRSLFLIPLLAVLLIAIPAVFFSLGGGVQVAVGQTAPPPPTGTVPGSPLPTPTRVVVPPTPRPIVPDGRVRANGWLLKEVIGNRLSSTIYGIAFSPRLYRTDNDGASWYLVTRFPEVTDFLMSPADPDVLYSTLDRGCDDAGGEATSLFKSDDGGVSWYDLEPGFALLPVFASPDDEDILIAAGCDGLYETEDGGESWSALVTAADDALFGEYIVTEVEAAYYADSQTAEMDYLYAVAQDNDGESVLLFSDDGGESWLVISPDSITQFISALAVDPQEIGRLWYAEESGVWTTEDQGQFWGFSSRGLERVLSRGLNDIVQWPDDTLYLATGQGLYAKSTSTTLWHRIGNAVIQRQNVLGLLFTDSDLDQLWLNAANGVYKYPVP